MATQTVYLIPDGPKNLASLFPEINWRDITEYFVQVLDVNSAIVGTTPLINLCNCVNDESVIVYFLNYLGNFDAAVFQKPHVIHEPSSSEFKKGLKYPLQKTDTGTERFNVVSNDTYEAKRKCIAEEMIWLQECADSPKAFMEWPGKEGQPEDYLPVVIINSKFDKLKNDLSEFQYEYVIQFKLSNEFFSIRN